MSEPWERGFVRRNLPLIAKGLIWSWLKVKPFEGKLEYYRALFLAAVVTLFKREASHPSKFLRKEVWVKYGGLKYLLTYKTVFGYYLHLFELRTAEILYSLSGDVFVDVGANVGQYAVPLAKRFRTVVAVEPNPGAIEILQRNLARNKLTNVRIISKAISSTRGYVLLYEGEYLSTWGLNQTGARNVRVESITMDDLLEEFETVDLLKVDIEGLESRVLLNAQSLGRVRHLSFAGVSPNRLELEEKLRRLGFSLRLPYSPWQVEENVDAINASQLPA
jgi:FkbM family methyltransferase